MDNQQELIPSSKSLSPRLKWMKEHNITPQLTVDGWEAVYATSGGSQIITASTKKQGLDEALFKMAKALRIRLWNEQDNIGEKLKS